MNCKILLAISTQRLSDLHVYIYVFKTVIYAYIRFSNFLLEPDIIMNILS